MRRIALFVVLGISIIAFGSVSASAQSTADQKYVGKKKVVIKPGDTLSKIAKANDTTYKRLFDANTNIKDPDVIYAGDKVRIPHPKEKLKSRQVAKPAPVTTVNSYQYQQPQVNAYQAAPSQRVASSNVNGGVWDRLAACESGGNWSINTGNGYFGGLQFDAGTWRSNGGSGLPHQASKSEQIRVAENLRAARGFSPWPACSAKLGLS